MADRRPKETRPALMRDSSYLYQNDMDVVLLEAPASEGAPDPRRAANGQK